MILPNIHALTSQVASLKQRGLTLADAVVAGFLITVGLGIIAGGVIQSLDSQRQSEHHAVTQSAQQDVIAQARQANYHDLGYFEDDPASGFSTSGDRIELPVRDNEGQGQQLEEEPVQLAQSRPSQPTTFTPPPVEKFSESGYTYRVDVAITHVTTGSADGNTAYARRATVQVESIPGADREDELTGSCEGDEVRCTHQTLVRVADAADPLMEDDEVADRTRCESDENIICTTFVRQGRVLDGAVLADDNEDPLQVSPVTFTARTSQPASDVQAEFTIVRPTPGGSTSTVTESLSLEPINAAGTRWAAEIPADSGHPKGLIRPGPAQASFTASFAGGTDTAEHGTVRWSLDVNQGLDTDHVTAEWVDDVPDGQAWCSPVGDGQDLRVQIEGHSVGLREDNTPTSGADTVTAAFTTTGPEDAVTTEKVEADLVSAEPETVTISGTVIEVATRATWAISPPATESCEAMRTVSVLVHRAADDTTTTIPLTLGGA